MATPLKKGDRIVAVPDGEGGTDAVDFVVIENRPRGHGLGVPIYMPNAVTVSVKRADDDAVLVSSTYGTVTASKPEEATEEFSGQL